MSGERMREIAGTFVPWDPAKPNGPGWIVAENGCHIWTGSRSTKGYARVNVAGRTKQAHRVRYEREIGPIPEGMELDHYVCDNGPGGCCNPHHCRPVTTRENLLRGNGITARNAAKTHCQRGHPFAGDNLTPDRLARGERECRICRNRYANERRRNVTIRRRAARALQLFSPDSAP